MTQDREDKEAVEEFRARLRREKGQLLEEDRARTQTKAGPSSQLGSMSRAMDLLAHMVGSLIGGAILGYGLDYILGSFPLAMIILSFLGLAGGTLSAARGLGGSLLHTPGKDRRKKRH